MLNTTYLIGARAQLSLFFAELHNYYHFAVGLVNNNTFLARSDGSQLVKN